MNLSENKPLNWQQQQDYNKSRNKSIFLSIIGTVVMLYFFSNNFIAMSAFAFVMISSVPYKQKMLKYKQGRDLKISLQFLGLSLFTAIAFWGWFLLF